MILQDYEAVYSLWMFCQGMGLNNLDDSKEGIGRFLERNPQTCFVAEDQGHIVGVILAGNDGRRGYIYHPPHLRNIADRESPPHWWITSLKAMQKLQISKVAMVAFERNEQGNAFYKTNRSCVPQQKSGRYDSNRYITKSNRQKTVAFVFGKYIRYCLISSTIFFAQTPFPISIAPMITLMILI